MKYLIPLLILCLSGCQMVGQYQQKAAKESAKGILTYCASVDEAYRLNYRAQVNEMLGGKADVEINCY